MTDRRTQLAENLAQVEERIASACASAGREREDVTLIVVTKTYPASDVRILYELGVRQLGCLIQVALDAESGERGDRGGVAPDAIEELAASVEEAEGLRLDGLMTVAPLAGPYAGRQRAAFDRLVEFSSRLRGNHPAANMVSAGMSADLEDAIAAGATHVRVGTAVLGVRARLGEGREEVGPQQKIWS